MLNKKRIEERQKTRKDIQISTTTTPGDYALLLISDSMDNYLEHRIQTDKVLEGILKDIQGGVAKITDSMVDVRCWMQENE